MKKIILMSAFVIAMSGNASAATLSASCSGGVATLSIGGVSSSDVVSISISQNGSSDWFDLGSSDAGAASLTIPVPGQSIGDLPASLTDYSTATYRVTAGGSTVSGTC